MTSRWTILSVLALSACVADAGSYGAGAGDDDDGSTGVGAANLINAKGADYAWSRPNPTTMHQQGFTFVARYLSYDTSGKNLTAGEATSLHNAGIDVIANWEAAADDALSGFNRGVSDAREALRQANQIGVPADRPIYFSVDFDAAESQQGTINSYFDGVASIIGANRVGAYAGYWVIKRLFDASKIQWGWQTLAWSGGNWDARAQLRQTSINNKCAGADCDFDMQTAADAGGWGPNTTATGPGASAQPPEGVAAFAVPNQQHVFTRAANGDLRHLFYDAGPKSVARDTWSSGIAGNPVTIVAGGAQHAFARGSDGSLQHAFWDPASGMHAAPWAGANAIAGDPAAIVIGQFQDVWAADAAGKLQHWFWGPNTNGVVHDTWGSGIVGRPSALVSGAQQHVFARGTNGSLEHFFWDPSGGIAHDTWAPAGTLAGDPAALAIDGGFQDVWAIDTAGKLQHWFWGPQTGGVKTDTWGSGVTGRPSVFAINGQQHAFARGTGGALEHWYWDAGTVKHDTWATTGVATDPTAILAGPAQHVWATDAAGHAQHWGWDPTVGHVTNDDWGQ